MRMMMNRVWLQKSAAILDMKNSSSCFMRLYGRGMASLSGGQKVEELAKQLPFKNAIRYEHKNQKYSFKDINQHSEDLACGFLEQGFQPGDIVLSWLPEHFSEQTVLQFACSKAGFILYSLDPSQAILDPQGAKTSLKLSLEVTKANILITQEAGSDVNYVRLCKEVIPEIRLWDFGTGLPFFSPRFPHLRYPVHTGFDHTNKTGMIPYNDMLIPSGELKSHLREHPPLDGTTPLYGTLQFSSVNSEATDGISLTLGKVYSNDEVVQNNVWPIYNDILNQNYKEIPGIGNIW